MKETKFVKILSTYIDKNFFKKGHGSNLPQAHACLFLMAMERKGFEVITRKQLVRLMQNYLKWESAKKQKGTKESAEEFMEVIGIL